MKILVLGATGYVGSRVVPALTEAGHSVRAASSSRLDPDRFAWGRQVEWARCDVTHRPDIAKHFHILQTPTTLVLDGDGVVQTRFGGVPNREVLELELNRLTGETAHV